MLVEGAGVPETGLADRPCLLEVSQFGQGDGPEARSALSGAPELAGQLGLVPLAERAGALHNRG